MKQTTWLTAVVMLAVGFNAGAGIIDLTTAGAVGGPVNGAIFEQSNFELSTGTGVFEPFVRLQSNGTEKGYNTTKNNEEWDTKQGLWTHPIQLSEIPICEGIFYKFELDINESSNQPKLSLDALKIHLADVGDLTGYGSNPDFGTALYDLDAGENNTVLLDYSLATGSGSGDMVACIPISALGTDGSKYVYLYSEFGSYTGSDEGWESSDGFEEWGIITPEPATMFILGLGSVLVRKRR
ncbi:MAG: PEP-CTERM sorting domain-containing protein [Planctomycetota bacterium]